MAYLLQPKSAYQTTMPNWYNVSYRRTGTYKGMGQVAPGYDPTPTYPSLGTVYPTTVFSGGSTNPGFAVSPGAAAGAGGSYVPLMIAGLLVFFFMGGFDSR